WTVRLGGWLPRFDRCSACDALFGTDAAYHAAWEPGLRCEKCKRSGMRPLQVAARHLAEAFTKQSLDKFDREEAVGIAAKELREASLNWIEYHSERRLATRTMLETS